VTARPNPRRRGPITDPAARRGLLDALRGARPILADRRVLPPEVERGLRALAAARP
jgi:hypothetical protein